MGTLTFFILSILCAGLQHEILAGGASSKDPPIASSSTSSPTRPSSPGIQIYHDGTRPTAVAIRSLPAAYEQSVYEVHTAKPTHVMLTKKRERLGPGFAIHCYFVVSRPKFFREGYEVSTYDGVKLKPHEVFETIRHGNVILIHTKVPLLLGNGYAVAGALSGAKYTPEEIQWADNYVRRDIKETYPPEPRTVEWD